MNSIERRKFIESILYKSNKPIKGSIIGEKLGVTRQVIVKDIAILRAEGKEIIATPEGYLTTKNNNHLISKVIAVNHNSENMQDELETIVKFGAIVKDVIIDHSVYGEIKAMLMIKSLYDIDNFIKKINKNKAEPLLILTGGLHLHTILAERQDIIDNVKKELQNKNYLINGE
ncbi:transcription repressor NadR [Clostridium niameyense]|uniref:Transcription repressor NadR n=1 Tax=Clostridium niameyense TaxID=1622073 RepID=A0A6M0RCL5_9CLOT|nr:transcription repressor NadR [Clostridium niameyense]NEZ48016.1 transcription repressor NadR [Clostridium niameyense]